MRNFIGIIGPRAADYRQAASRMLEALTCKTVAANFYIAPSGSCVLGYVPALQTQTAPRPDTAECRFVYLANENLQTLSDAVALQLAPNDAPLSDKNFVKFLEHAAHNCRSAHNPALLWDERHRECLIARDVFGENPLYYARAQNLFLLASEARALPASGLIPRLLDLNGVAGYLSFGALPVPNSLIAGVKALPSAAFMRLKKNRMDSPIYYRTPSYEKQNLTPRDVRSLFAAAVKRHLTAGQTTGVFLSGGLDSSAIALAAAQARVCEIKTLTLTFPEQTQLSEALYAKHIAKTIQSQHHEIPLTTADMLHYALKAIKSMDQPSIDFLNTFIAARAAKDLGLAVALSGLGGDELFGGYPAFRDVPWLAKLPKMPFLPANILRKVIAATGKWHTRTAKTADSLIAAGHLLDAYFLRRRLFSPLQIDQLLTSQAKSGISDFSLKLPPPKLDLARLQHIIEKRDVLDAVSLLEITTYMSDILLRDTRAAELKHELEIRHPFLDREFAGSMLSLEPDARNPLPAPKHRFAEAVRGWLPESILTRKKQGFVLPMPDLLSGPLRSMAEEELFENTSLCSFIKPAVLQVLWKTFLTKPQAVGWARPWSLFVLSRFLRDNELQL